MDRADRVSLPGGIAAQRSDERPRLQEVRGLDGLLPQPHFRLFQRLFRIWECGAVTRVIGFVGLGNMGKELATNLVDAGHEVVAHDAAGSSRNPAGAVFVDNIAELSRRATIAVLSLPDGSASRSVCTAIAQTPSRRVTHVLDTSTVGLDASARSLHSSPATTSDTSMRLCQGALPAHVLGLSLSCTQVVRTIVVAVDEVIAGLSDRRFLRRR